MRRLRRAWIDRQVRRRHTDWLIRQQWPTGGERRPRWPIGQLVSELSRTANEPAAVATWKWRWRGGPIAYVTAEQLRMMSAVSVDPAVLEPGHVLWWLTGAFPCPARVTARHLGLELFELERQGGGAVDWLGIRLHRLSLAAGDAQARILRYLARVGLAVPQEATSRSWWDLRPLRWLRQRLWGWRPQAGPQPPEHVNARCLLITINGQDLPGPEVERASAAVRDLGAAFHQLDAAMTEAGDAMRALPPLPPLEDDDAQLP